MWTSADGTAWRPVPVPTGVFSNASLTDVSVGGPGLIAVGSVQEPASTYATPLEHAAVWTSADGLAWTRVPDNPAVFGTFADAIEMDAIAAGRHGFVALGVYHLRHPDFHGLLWFSPDGITWRRARTYPFLAVGSGLDWWGVQIAPGGKNFVATDDSSADVESTLWSSSDGLHWTLRGGAAVFGGHADVSGLAASGDRLAAVASFFEPPPSCSSGHAREQLLDLPESEEAVLLWSPAKKGSASGLRTIDPFNLRLRPYDLPPSPFLAGQPPSATGGYSEAVCWPLYSVLYSYSRIDWIQASVGVAQSVAAAQAAFRHPGLFVELPGASFPRSLGCDMSLARSPRRLSTPARIGADTQVFRLDVKEVCAPGPGPRDEPPLTYAVLADAVVWRSGNVVGEVASTDSTGEAIALARRELARANVGGHP
jgi:hypothetical protein